MMDKDKEIAFAPFHVINNFMRADFRHEVVRRTMTALKELPRAFAGPIDSQVRKQVKVPGFRNSAKAPLSVKMGPTLEAFEKQPRNGQCHVGSMG